MGGDAPPPYSRSAGDGRTSVLINEPSPPGADVHPQLSRKERKLAAHYLTPVWGIHARWPCRLDVIILVLAFFSAIMAIADGVNATAFCAYDEVERSLCRNKGLWFLANMPLSLATMAHSIVLITLVRLSPSKIEAHRFLHRPGPKYTLAASCVLAVSWPCIVWSFYTHEAEDYLEGSDLYRLRLVLAHLMTLVQVMYCGFSFDVLYRKDAIVGQLQRKIDHDQNLAQGARTSDAVELQHVVGKTSV